MAEEWKNFYQAAILETDWSRIEGRIQVADSAIRARLHEFSLNHGGTPEENQDIKDALTGLTVFVTKLPSTQRSPKFLETTTLDNPGASKLRQCLNIICRRKRCYWLMTARRYAGQCGPCSTLIQSFRWLAKQSTDARPSRKPLSKAK